MHLKEMSTFDTLRSRKKESHLFIRVREPKLELLRFEEEQLGQELGDRLRSKKRFVGRPVQNGQRGVAPVVPHEPDPNEIVGVRNGRRVGVRHLLPRLDDRQVGEGSGLRGREGEYLPRSCRCTGSGRRGLWSGSARPASRPSFSLVTFTFPIILAFFGNGRCIFLSLWSAAGLLLR